MQELKLQEKEEKRKQVESNKRKAKEIRKAAMKGRASKSLLSKHTIHVFISISLSFSFNNFRKQ